MRTTERRLRKTIKRIISESYYDGTMNPEDPLEYYIEHQYLGQEPSGAQGGRVKFSEVMSTLHRDAEGRQITTDDVLVAIASKPGKYRLDGCWVVFLDFA